MIFHAANHMRSRSKIQSHLISQNTNWVNRTIYCTNYQALYLAELNYFVKQATADTFQVLSINIIPDMIRIYPRPLWPPSSCSSTIFASWNWFSCIKEIHSFEEFFPFVSRIDLYSFLKTIFSGYLIFRINISTKLCWSWFGSGYYYVIHTLGYS